MERGNKWNMADTGWLSPGTVESESWSGSFTIPLIGTSDNTYAAHTGTTYQTAIVKTFGISIPSGSVINGIEVKAEFRASMYQPPWTPPDPKPPQLPNAAAIRISLSKDSGSSYTATQEETVVGIPDAIKYYGATDDLWSESWEAEDFSSTFRVKVEGKGIDLNGGGNVSVYLDHLQLVVYYTEARTGVLAQTEAGDTIAGTGTLLVAGVLAKTEANDTVAAAGALEIAGALAKTEADDTLVSEITADTGWGDLVVTEANDTVASAGTVLIAGAAAPTEEDDAVASAGTVLITGAARRADDGHE